MKKIVSILIVAALCVACMGISVLAAENATVSVTTETAKNGETVTLHVSVSEVTIEGYTMVVEYDESALKLVDIAARENETGVFVANEPSEYASYEEYLANENRGTVSLFFVTGPATVNGELFSVKFEVLAETEGEYAVSVNVKELGGKADAVVNGGAVVIPHEHNYEKTVVEPTCTEAGKVIYTCACGDSYEEAGEGPLGHDHQVKEHKGENCTEDGYTIYECTRCFDSYREDHKAHGHNFEYVGETEDGSKYVCSHCGEVMYEKPGDMIGVVVALLAVSGLGITVLKKREN